MCFDSLYASVYQPNDYENIGDLSFSEIFRYIKSGEQSVTYALEGCLISLSGRFCDMQQIDEDDIYNQMALFESTATQNSKPAFIRQLQKDPYTLAMWHIQDKTFWLVRTSVNHFTEHQRNYRSILFYYLKHYQFQLFHNQGHINALTKLTYDPKAFINLRASVFPNKLPETAINYPKTGSRKRNSYADRRQMKRLIAFSQKYRTDFMHAHQQWYEAACVLATCFTPDLAENYLLRLTATDPQTRCDDLSRQLLLFCYQNAERHHLSFSHLLRSAKAQGFKLYATETFYHIK